MKQDIKVYPEILKVQLAYNYGWQEAAAHKVIVQGIEFSFVIYGEDNPSVIVSMLDGGCGITTISISPLLAFFGADKETTLKMLKDKAEIVSRIIDANGKDYILELAEKKKKEHETKFGQMPPVELYDLSNVSERVRKALTD